MDSMVNIREKIAPSKRPEDQDSDYLGVHRQSLSQQPVAGGFDRSTERALTELAWSFSPRPGAQDRGWLIVAETLR